jgi:hypothetical protein
VPVETLNGGCPNEIISLLTGRQTKLWDMGKTGHREQLHNMLAETTRKRRLICINSEAKKPPPGVAAGHCYAIFGYDANQRKVTIFNPWGNNFTPKGPAGLANGYPTQRGLFTVPLSQFDRIFTQLSYEIDKPLGK